MARAIRGSWNAKVPDESGSMFGKLGNDPSSARPTEPLRRAGVVKGVANSPREGEQTNGDQDTAITPRECLTT